MNPHHSSSRATSALMQIILVVSFAILLIPAVAIAHGYKQKTIEIVHPWTSERAEAEGREATISMKIRNVAKIPDRLLSVRTKIADRAELRDASGAVLAKGIDIPADSVLELKDGAVRIQLVGLKKKLVAYDGLPMLLEFTNAGRVAVEAMVEEASSGDAPADKPAAAAPGQRPASPATEKRAAPHAHH